MYVYLSTWSAFGGPQPTVDVDQAAIQNGGAGGKWNHLRYHPADGTFVHRTTTGQIYRFAGGAPVHVSSWGAVGTPQPATGIRVGWCVLGRGGFSRTAWSRSPGVDSRARCRRLGG
ncbi:hypothetical protein Aglo03_29050 [Actinokineospora globicatena]|uniref:Uncharacterized protein n=1 Tax=Actinokineospora globicatena TaxID=103729 RepID=A0A9W6V9L8_9PSEU|nr:hypothetical protein Aglo03_29050 [Actinokineospora globicatena]